MTQAFPTLFPNGQGDFYQGRIRDVDLGDYFAHLLKFHDGRFARHRRWPWFAFNTLQRQRSYSQARIFVKQKQDAAQLSAADIAAMLAEGDESLVRNMIRYGANLRGTRAYWSARRQEVTDMIRVLGSPHVFFTLSAADLQWPDLHKHMPPECEVPAGDDQAARRQRRLALINNPHLAAAYLDLRAQLFLKHVLCPLLGVKHFWFRYEWQERGSGHIHGFLWLKDAPNPDDINWDLLKENDNQPIGEEQETKMKEFVTYWDKIVTACSPFPVVDDNQPFIGPHPAAKERDTCRNTKEELAEMVNRVERHTKCMPGYCQVKRKVTGANGPEMKTFCRFDYPMECRAEPGVGFDSKKRVRFEPRRNDRLMNAHSPVMILGWRANIDLKPVMSIDAALK